MTGNKSLTDLGAATPSDITEAFAPSGITIAEGGTFPSGSRALLTEHKPIMVNDDQYYFLEETGVDYLYGSMPTSGAFPSMSYFRVMKSSFAVEFHNTAIDTTPTEDSANLITSGAVYDAVQSGSDLSAYLTKAEASSTYETQSAATASLSQKADKSTTYTKTETNAAITTEVNAMGATKVDKVAGKGLSTNDFTTTEKNKLAGIASGATAVTVATSITSSGTNPVRSSAIYSALSDKVDKVSGKGLSTNDFTDDLLSKLGALTLKSVLQGQSNSVSKSYTYTMNTSDFGSDYNALGLYLLFFVSWGTTPSISIYSVAYSGGTVDNASTLKIAGDDKTITVSSGTISFSAPGLVRIVALS